MKREFISKIILGAIISTSLYTLIPTKASADWVNDYQGNWYYMQDNAKVTGWKKIDGELYYFDQNGKMQKGWIQAGNSYYFLQNNGALKIGWINYNNNWYYADSNGAIQTGTINIAGKVYVFNNSGVMQTSNVVIDGQFYTIGSDGQVVGMKTPTPNKEYDASGNLVQVLKNTDNNVVTSPTESKYNQVIEDQTVSDEDPKTGRSFKITFKDSNGAELKSKEVKYEKKIDLYTPTKTGYVFSNWNTRSDGTGKKYSSSDDVKITENLNLYAQWTTDTNIYVDSIDIKGSSDVVIGKTIQFTADVSPSDATNKDVSWSVTGGTGTASIDSNGVLTGSTSGTVTVTATSKDNSKVTATKPVTVGTTEVVKPITHITVSSDNGYAITTNGGTLQFKAIVAPDDANGEIEWTVDNVEGSASIDATGKLTAISNGRVTVIAKAKNNSTVYGSMPVDISNQSVSIPIQTLTLEGKDNKTQITDDNGQLQMVTEIQPASTSLKGVDLRIVQGGESYTDDKNVTTTYNGKASFDPSSGIIKATENGKGNGDVLIVATSKAKDENNKPIVQTKVININQAIKVSKITIGGNDPLEVNGTGKVTLGATVYGNNSQDPLKEPPNNPKLEWTIDKEINGHASIAPGSNELLPLVNGTVIIKATAKDGSGVYATRTVNISGIQGQQIGATNINISGKDDNEGQFNLYNDDDTLDLVATLTPSYSTTTPAAIKWNIATENDGGEADFVKDSNITTTTSSAVTIKAVKNGTVKVTATLQAADNYSKEISKSVYITMYNQYQQVTGINITAPPNTPLNTGNFEVGKNEKLQLSAEVLPSDAQNKAVKWEAVTVMGGGKAEFDPNTPGLLIGKETGPVTVRVCSTDDHKYIKEITVDVVEPILPSSVSIATAGGITDPDGKTIDITKNKGTLKLTANVDANATSKAVSWTVSDTSIADFTYKDDGTATLQAKTNGTVTVIATACSGGKIATQDINISGQNPDKLLVSGPDWVNVVNGVIQMNNTAQTLMMKYSLYPSNTTTPAGATVKWSVPQDQIIATIESNGKLTATGNGNGTVTVTATVQAQDGSTVASGSVPVNVNVPTGIQITQALINGTTTNYFTSTSKNVTVAAGSSIQFSASVLPDKAADKTVNWKVNNTLGDTFAHASFSTNSPGYLLTNAASPGGTIEVIATSDSNSTKSNSVYVTITKK